MILDTEVKSYDELFDIAGKAIAAGVDIIQLRDKGGNAADILKFSKEVLRVTKGRIPYIINDRVDLAIIAKASGVHLGQEDIPIKIARKMLGPKAIIGTSCQTFAHLAAAQKAGVDYIGFGSIFKTLTKPNRSPMDLNLLKKVVQYNQVPIFAIGGIDLNNVDQIKMRGIKRIAVCRAILEAQNVQDQVRKFKDRI